MVELQSNTRSGSNSTTQDRSERITEPSTDRKNAVSKNWATADNESQEAPRGWKQRWRKMNTSAADGQTKYAPNPRADSDFSLKHLKCDRYLISDHEFRIVTNSNRPLLNTPLKLNPYKDIQAMLVIGGEYWATRFVKLRLKLVRRVPTSQEMWTIQSMLLQRGVGSGDGDPPIKTCKLQLYSLRANSALRFDMETKDLPISCPV